MAVTVEGKPDTMQMVSAHLTVRDAAKAIEFYSRAFGAEELYRTQLPNGQVMHAEVKLGRSVLMLAEEMAQRPRGPDEKVGTPIALHLYVDDVDSAVARAVKAGATVAFPVADMFWGDRYAQLKDPFGHLWSLATAKEAVSPDEVGRRARAFGGGAC
jgi:PhnB protein